MLHLEIVALLLTIRPCRHRHRFAVARLSNDLFILSCSPLRRSICTCRLRPPAILVSRPRGIFPLTCLASPAVFLSRHLPRLSGGFDNGITSLSPLRRVLFFRATSHCPRLSGAFLHRDAVALASPATHLSRNLLLRVRCLSGDSSLSRAPLRRFIFSQRSLWFFHQLSPFRTLDGFVQPIMVLAALRRRGGSSITLLPGQFSRSADYSSRLTAASLQPQSLLLRDTCHRSLPFLWPAADRSTAWLSALTPGHLEPRVHHHVLHVPPGFPLACLMSFSCSLWQSFPAFYDIEALSPFFVPFNLHCFEATSELIVPPCHSA